MGETTKIAWTQRTFNPWIGCTKVSPGCDHCYAESLNHRWGNDNWGKGKPRRTTADSNWREPLKWNKLAQEAGEQHLVFCASLADVMDDEAPEGVRERLWALINATPHLTWQLLTKRPQRYARYLPQLGFDHNNVWLGISAENQEFYDVRWPYLRDICGEHKLISFISYEPALGPLSIDKWMTQYLMRNNAAYFRLLPHWIICGGESGAGRRPMEQKWAEDLRRECEMWQVDFFMKQMSARTPEEGAKLIPAHLLVRQFPGGKVQHETEEGHPVGE